MNNRINLFKTWAVAGATACAAVSGYAVDPIDISADVEKFAPGWRVAHCANEVEPGLRDAWDGRRNVLVTHPMSESEPCSLSKTVEIPRNLKTTLFLDVGYRKNGDWILVVKANGKTLVQRPIGNEGPSNGWTEVVVNLSAFAGESIDLELQNAANDWSWEAGFWSRIEILSEPWLGALVNRYDVLRKDLSKDIARIAPEWRIANCRAFPEPGFHKEWAGRKNVLVTHPLDFTVPCSLYRTIYVAPGKKTTLELDIGHHERGDWRLVVLANGNPIVMETIGEDTCIDRWRTVTVDLTPFAGTRVKLELLHQADEWAWELGHWSRIEILETDWDDA